MIIDKKYLAMRKKTYITTHPTILRMFIAEQGIHVKKWSSRAMREMVIFHNDAADRVSKFKKMLTMNYIKNNATDCGWILAFLDSYEDAMEYFLETNKNDMNMSDWPYNKFTWSETIYKRELSRDIVDRRGRIKELLHTANTPVCITYVIARYIDYV
jgi:hypothetical protein